MISVLADIANGIGPPDSFFNKSYYDKIGLILTIVITITISLIVFIIEIIAFFRKKKEKQNTSNDKE